MSGVLGVFELAGGPVDVEAATHLARRQFWRGGPDAASVATPSAYLSVSRFDWELAPDMSGDVFVLDDSRYLIAMDGCLFYRRELDERLRRAGVQPLGSTSSHLVLASYKAWGTECAQHLEGTFSFILYDRQTATVCCARDDFGSRPLFFARFDQTLIIASTIGAILEHEKCSDTLDVAAIGVAAAGWLMCCGDDTCYEDVRVVPNACTMTWVGGRESTWRHWEPPPRFDASGATSFHDGAEELRELLVRAVSERSANEGCTTVWMSGGRDSTAVFAAGQLALSREGSGRILRPVSVSYPEGDLGREDEWIEAVADRWQSKIHWIDIADIPMFAAEAERAATREEPATSPYENWNVALGRGTRACGARIALDGNGGDQLFRTHDIYHADLLGSGRLFELARELWAKRSRGRRYLFETTVLPVLPGMLAAAYARSRNVGSRHYMQFPMPAWLRQDFLDRHQLVDRQIAALPNAREKSRESALMRWYLSSPMFGYALAVLQQRLLPAGVELRSPLLDRRVIELAFRRPRHERAYGLEEKRLLRESMRGAIPDHVLAPRSARTGVTISYSRRSMRDNLPAMFRELLETPLQLAQLGIADPGRIRDELVACERGRLTEFARIALFHAFQAELWLRHRR